MLEQTRGLIALCCPCNFQCWMGSLSQEMEQTVFSSNSRDVNQAQVISQLQQDEPI